MKFKKGDRVVDEQGDLATFLRYSENGVRVIKYDDDNYNHDGECDVHNTEFKLTYVTPPDTPNQNVCKITTSLGRVYKILDYVDCRKEDSFYIFYSKDRFIMIREDIINTVQVTNKGD